MPIMYIQNYQCATVVLFIIIIKTQVTIAVVA